MAEYVRIPVEFAICCANFPTLSRIHNNIRSHCDVRSYDSDSVKFASVNGDEEGVRKMTS